MRISELLRLDERAPLLNKLANAAKIHYNTQDENEALLLYLARGMMHSEEDDKELKKDDEYLKKEDEYFKKELAQLKQKVDHLDNKIKTDPVAVMPSKEVNFTRPKPGGFK